MLVLDVVEVDVVPESGIRQTSRSIEGYHDVLNGHIRVDVVAVVLVVGTVAVVVLPIEKRVFDGK